MPPTNDAFADAEALTGDTGSVSGTTVDATTESGEADLYYGTPDTHSVWYQWTATDHGYLTLDSIGTPADPPQVLFVVGLYQGTAVDGLTLVGSGVWWNFSPVAMSKLFSIAEAGTYYIRVVSGYDTKYGPFVLNWSFQQADPVANDAWADATTISGTSGSIVGTTAGATAEADEPDNYNSDTISVWYRWTAPEDGYQSFTNTGTPEIAGVYLYFWLYQGIDIAGLEMIGNGAGADFGGAFYGGVTGVRAGHVYYVRAGVQNNIGGPFTLNWSFEHVERPSNDDLADAQVLTGTSGSVTGSLRGAGKEPDEQGYSSSIWYSWTAPDSGVARFDTEGTNFWDWGSGLTVWSGGPGMLDLVEEECWEQQAGGDPYFDVLNFEAVEGTTYYVRLSGDGWEMDNLNADTVLNWHLGVRGAPPANDDWANATLISGTSGTISGTTLGATVQDGDQNWEDYYGNATVWYRMVVTEDILLTFTCVSDALQPMLALYTLDEGDPVELGWLGEWWQESGNLQPNYLDTFFSETLTPGTWWIQVGSVDDGIEGDFQLSWVSPPPPVITSFTPTSGAIGTEVTITGAHFEGRGSLYVYIGGAYSPYTIVNDSTIVATAGTWHTHAGATHGGVGPVTIWSDLGSTASEQTFTSPVVTPIVTGFSPDGGFPAEGYVTVTGTNFRGANEVIIGDGGYPVGYGDSGDDYSDTTLSVPIPTGATTGPVRVRHHNQIGSSAATMDIAAYTQIPAKIATQATAAWSPTLAPYVWYAQPEAPNNTIVFFRDWDEPWIDRFQVVNDADIFNVFAVDTFTMHDPPAAWPGRGRMELLQRQSDGTFVHKQTVFYTEENLNGAAEFGQTMLAGGKVLFAYQDQSVLKTIHGGSLQGYWNSGAPAAFQIVAVSEDANMTVTVHPPVLLAPTYNSNTPTHSGDSIGPAANYGNGDNMTSEAYWDDRIAENKLYVAGWVNKPLCSFPGTTYALFTYNAGGLASGPRCEVIDCSGAEPTRPPNLGEDGTYPFGSPGTLTKCANWPYVTSDPDSVDGGYTYLADRSDSYRYHVESLGIDATRALVFGRRTLRASPYTTDWVASVVTRSGQLLSAGPLATVLGQDEAVIPDQVFNGQYLNENDFSLTQLGDGRFLMTICPRRLERWTPPTWTWITWFRVLTVTGNTLSVGPLGQSWLKTPRYVPNAVYPYGGEGDFLLVDTWRPEGNVYATQYGGLNAWAYDATQRVQAWRAEEDGTVHPSTNAMAWPDTIDTHPYSYAPDYTVTYNSGLAGRWLTNPTRPDLNPLPAAMFYLDGQVPLWPETSVEQRAFTTPLVPSPIALVDLVDLEPEPEPEPCIPPANNNWANAQVLIGSSGSVVGTTLCATLEPDEPDTAS